MIRYRILACCRLLFVPALFVVAFSGCYPKPIGPPGPTGQSLTWAEMNIDQKKAHMRTAVLPKAAALFREWRPAKYANVDCLLCHGSGVYTGNYHMPTDQLPRLSGDWLLGPEREKYPDTTQLKLDRLVPEISTALGVKPFSLITRRGFGCYSCHLGPDGPMFGN